MASRFKEYRDALAQAAEAPQISLGSSAMQAADALFSQAGALANYSSGSKYGLGDLKEMIGSLPQVAKLAEVEKLKMDPAAQNNPVSSPIDLEPGSVKEKTYQGLINRGMSPTYAKAFLYNFEDESGFKLDAREGVPNVHGTRGFGLYQLTDTEPGVGRETNYRNFVKQNNLTFGSLDSQLDFLMHELQGPEKAAWQAIQNSSNTGEAAALIVDKFLRPAKEHKIRRMNKYRQLG